jgi:hypothetical protein
VTGPPLPPWPPPSEERRSVTYLAWRVSTAMTYALVVVAVGCLVMEVVIWGLTFASPSITMPDWIQFPFFAFGIFGMFAIFGLAMFTHGSTTLVRLNRFRHLPGWVIVGLILTGLVFVATGPFKLFADLPGQPGFNTSTKQYYFNNHGQVIPTDRIHYLAGVATQTRGFISFALGMTCLVVLLAGAELALRRSVRVPRYRDIPLPTSPLPRFWPPTTLAVALTIIGLVVGSFGFSVIVDHVDSYLANPIAVTTSGTTEQLTAGPWVVFTWCETHATNAPYGCPQLNPSDIVIQDLASGAVLESLPDPSVDHISPEELPASGQLVFRVPSRGSYLLRLTRPVPKGVFVSESPGTIARGVAGAIVLTLVGLGIFVFGCATWIRRVNWRFSGAPRVVVPDAPT